MVGWACGTSAACLALSFVIISTCVFANDEEDRSQEVVAERGTGHCLLQEARARSKVHRHTRLHVIKHMATPEEEKTALSWTTNIGQELHNCTGSRFELDFNGTRSGMAVTNGILLKKGDCSLTPNSPKPVLTQELSCTPETTGCHMWCAPVWQSDYDTTDWSGYDSRCNNWDGSFNGADSLCAKTGRLFTWARAHTPSNKNVLDLNFAIPNNCSSWGSPLWVTIYDPMNWAKSYRWCFNQKNDWGACDVSEDVSLSQWHNREFKFSSFAEKHGYAAQGYALELAVYAESQALEVLVNNLRLRHVQELTTSEPPSQWVLDAEMANAKSCGSEGTCGIEHQCCRKNNSTVDARCCPKAWQCCEDSCCPQYYTCNISPTGHTCSPPEREIVHTPPGLCQM